MKILRSTATDDAHLHAHHFFLHHIAIGFVQSRNTACGMDQHHSFTSPIIMMGRIPFGVPNTVPYWQLAASMLSLIGGFIFTTWFAGKIYRTGILLYGKKVTWKEMLKWSFRKS